MGRRRNELRNAAGFIFRLRIIAGVQDLKISFYEQILVPLFLPGALSLRMLWRPHWLVVTIKVGLGLGLLLEKEFELG